MRLAVAADHHRHNRVARGLVVACLTLLALGLLGGCGAKHWSAVTSSTKQDLHALSFSGPVHGWAVGDSGTIVATSDGGKRWIAEHSGTSEDLRGVDFPDPLHGWAVGAGNTIIATSNGGATWHPQVSGVVSDTLTTVVFLDARHGWVGTDDGRVLWTRDGGANWHWHAYLSPASNPWVASLSLVSPRLGWALNWGGDYLDSPTTTVSRSRDGGVTWTAQRTLPGLSSSVFFLDARQGWLAADNGVYATDDGGAHWSLHATPLHEANLAVAFADPRHGWVAGGEGGIAMTSDGGRTWRASDMGSFTDLVDVACVDADHAFAVGNNGTILALRR